MSAVTDSESTKQQKQSLINVMSFPNPSMKCKIKKSC